MKNLLFLSFIALSFTACQKSQTEPSIIIEPPPTVMISSDTLTHGERWGAAIGSSADEVYTMLQSKKQNDYLNVVGNVFTRLEDQADRIPLYTSVLLDEQSGTSTGIQIYFENDKVKSIYTNSGTLLQQWPAGNTNSVAVGNKVTDVYAKLINIKQNTAYAKKFERISLFSKDMSKAYDTQMSVSPQWYFSVKVDDKRFYIISLNFTAGKLASIYTALYKTGS